LPADFCYNPEGGIPADPRLRLYDPRRDSEALKQNPENFEALRGNYPLRRESFESIKS
jgi:erythronate-4-phosphate dehydrogenase